MSEIKHTPGPWNLHKHAFACVTSEKMMVANCAGTTSNVEDLQPTQMANARLIAAAPELLYALIGLLETYGKPDEKVCCSGFECGCQGATAWQEAEHYARAAIAKAEGRQP